MRILPRKTNTIAYLISMRWYSALIAVMAGWLGIVFCGVRPHSTDAIIALSILLVGWGVNQIINDYFGLAEDRHNAPTRPMVTGALPVRFALTLSGILFIIGLVLTFSLNPSAVIFYCIVFAFNIIYARVKRMPLLGNFFFGLLIAPCVYYSAACVNNRAFLEVLLDSKLAALALLVWMVNFALCFFSDFKDYDGDKKENIKTLVVLLGLQKARIIGCIIALIPFLYVWFLLQQPALSSYRTTPVFIAMMVTTVLLFFWPVVLLIKDPRGRNTFLALQWITIGAILFETALVGLAYPMLSLILFISNGITARLLFYMYREYPL
ncbi:UbiA family prenyltransferase [Candidatus Omnitrophota bacterium]